MKKVFYSSLFLMFFVSYGFAQAEGSIEQQSQMMQCPKMQMMQGQGMMQGEGQQKPMMQGGMMGGMMGQGMMCPQMKHGMGQGMMMQDMMWMMIDIMKMQQKMIRGLSNIEKKEMTKEIDKMIERMERMIYETRGMMRGMASPPPAETPGLPQEEQKKEGAPKPEQHKH